MENILKTPLKASLITFEIFLGVALLIDASQRIRKGLDL